MVLNELRVTRPQAARRDYDPWIVLASIVLLSLLPSLSKFGLFGMDGDVESGSLASQLLWGLVYVVSAWRLVELRGEAVRLARRSTPLVGFLVIIALSYFWSVDPWVTLRNAIEMIGTTLLCYFIVLRFTMKEFLDILTRYFGAVLILSLGLVVAWPSHGRSTGGVVGWCGLFSEKNGFGAACGLAILAFSAALAIDTGKRRARLWGGLALSVVSLAGSQAITAAVTIVAAGSIVLATAACAPKRSGIFARVAIPPLVMAIGIAIVATGVRASTFFALVGKSSTLTGRADFWPGVLRAIGDRPLLGFGYNAFFFTESTVQEYIAGLTGWWIPLTAHNSYYQMTLSVGFVGTAMFALAVLPALGISFVRVIRDREFGLSWALGIICYALIGSFTEVYVGIPNSIVSICFMIAILYPMKPTKAPTPVKLHPRLIVPKSSNQPARSSIS